MHAVLRSGNTELNKASLPSKGSPLSNGTDISTYNQKQLIRTFVEGDAEGKVSESFLKELTSDLSFPR